MTNLFASASRKNRWVLRQEGIDWKRLAFWESINSISNGWIGMRGSFEEPMPDTRSQPMSFMAGLYDTNPGGVADIVLLPDWLTTVITLDGVPYDPRRGKILSFRRLLDMERGVFFRSVTWQDHRGRVTRLCFTRFLSMSDRRLALVRISIRPVNWAGRVEVESGLSFSKHFRGAEHWLPAELSLPEERCALLQIRTQQKQDRLIMAAGYQLPQGLGASAAAVQSETTVGWKVAVHAQAGMWHQFDRFVAFDLAAADTLDAEAKIAVAVKAATTVQFEAEFQAHTAQWREIWKASDVQIAGPVEDQTAIRYNLFQLSAVTPRGDQHAGIGARGLTGQQYSCHVFWDSEVYLLPFLSFTQPEAARTNLMYRYNTLAGARRKAVENGYIGAQFAWESADTGDESAWIWSTDEKTGKRVRGWYWDMQEHISSDICYACMQYVQTSGDQDFLWNHVAQIFFETSRFWASRVKLNDQTGQYEILQLIGPDEFHQLVDNNAYTNYMVQWHLRTAADLYFHWGGPPTQHEGLIRLLDLSDHEVRQWQHIADKIKTPLDPETGFVLQCDGFDQIPDAEPSLCQLMGHLGIFSIVGEKFTTGYHILKQADVVLLQQMLPERFDQKSLECNFDYYEPRTVHDSSLSTGIHAINAAWLGRTDQAYYYFRRSAFLDLENHIGTSDNGLHTANLGNLWRAVVLGLAGLRLENGQVKTKPCLPAVWQGLRFTIKVHGKTQQVTITK